MVIFIPAYLNSYIDENRNKDYQSKIIIREFEELLAYKYQEQIQEIINKMVLELDTSGRKPQYFIDCPEFITAKYQTILFSKFDLLLEVSQINPFASEYFIWMDAGTFYQDPPFDYNLPWRDPHKIGILQDKFLVPNYNFNVNDKSALRNKRAYLCGHTNNVCAYMLGGNKKAVSNAHEQFWREVHNAFKLGAINNDQTLLELAIYENPDDYYLWWRVPNYCFPFPLCDRTIPYELAIGTHIKEDYPVNHKIKLLTIATKNISPHTYHRWERTAKHDYEIIGKDKPWEGFSTKIKLFYEALINLSHPYAVMTDCTDVFLCAPPEELLEKFIKLGKDPVVGGEMDTHYPDGKYDKKIMIEFFNKIKQSEQAFPNSGFIMGSIKQLINLMKIHLYCHDDQVACFDTIYENTAPLSIDYDTVLIGNVPNYGHVKSEEYYEFDHKNGRYRNIHSGEYPIVFHFPGKNFTQMAIFYDNSFGEEFSDNNNNTTSNVGWGFLIIIIFVILIILFVYLGTPGIYI